MKDKIITFLFVGYLFIFSVLHLIVPDHALSVTERRSLASFPKFKFDSEYIVKVDKYLLDHFPFRNGFRSIKALYNYNLLNKLDNNGIFLKDDAIYKSNYPTDYDSIDNFIDHIEVLKSNLNNNKIYMMIIPDKNYYLEEKDFLHIDYDYIYDKLESIGLNNIDVRKILTKDDYYKTDTHWKQEKLDKVVEEMSLVMDFGYGEEKYVLHSYNDFYGVYYGESAMNIDAEKLVYVTNDLIDNAEVKYLENNNLNKVYNIDKLYGLDSYEVYLDGASSYIEIYNNTINNDKELVIFRDSFASSISPLLIKYYSKITLIDNRYISSQIFNDLIDFENQDVLFMYSTLLVNSSDSLKK